MGKTKKHCIIGAGFSGLTAARKLVELGEDFVIYDKNAGVGGLWHTGVYDSAHLVSSKTNTQFPDFPMPEYYPDFPGKPLMQKYLHDYARHFGILPKINFNKTVARVCPASDSEETLDWLVEINGEPPQRFGTVIVANGHLSGMSKPRQVAYPGEFAGEMLYVNAYQNACRFKDQKLLVVGAGNTGCDIAVDASYEAEKTHLSMKHGQYFLPKTFMGIPISDLSSPRVRLGSGFERLAGKVICWLSVGDLTRYGLPPPDHKLFAKHPTINTQVLYQIKHGHIQVKPEIKRYDGKMVEFVDGSRDEYDVIMFALGYHVTFPMIHAEDKLLDWAGDVPILFWGLMAPKYRGLFFSGLGQARTGGGPLFQHGGNIIARLAAKEIASDAGVMALLQRHRGLAFAQKYFRMKFVDKLETRSLSGEQVRKQIRWAYKFLDAIGCPDTPGT